MSVSLPGGTALVTGASSGIGKACAIAFAKAGVTGLFLADINDSGLEDTIIQCKKNASHAQFRAVPKKVDVTKEDDVVAMVQDAVTEFGRLDYAANVAGIGDIPKPTALHTVEEFDRVHSVNVRGVFLCMREEIKAMLLNEAIVLLEGRAPTRGSIVNMGSIGSQIVIPGMTGYVSSKFAVDGLTKTAAVSHGEDGIRLNTVNPGFIVTPLFRNTYADLTPFENLAAIKRMGIPEEIADLTLWLSSPMASFITGAAINCDGGTTLT